MDSSRTQKGPLRRKREGQVTCAEARLFTFICLATSLTSERQKPRESHATAQINPWTTSLASTISTTSWFRYLDTTKKVWTSTVCMFKPYLPHVEDWECTIKDHLQNQGNCYGKHANYLHYSYTSLTALSLMQLQAASKECKNKNQPERHDSLKKLF